MKNSSVSFSVVTASYNHSEYISDTIRSVLQQDYPDVEHIIVDGGSTDSTQKVVENYQSNEHADIKFIQEPDDGVYDAINKGISIASGDVIATINSDDWLADEALKKVANKYDGQTDIYYADKIMVESINGQKFFKRIKSSESPSLPFCSKIFHPSSFISKKWYNNYGKYNTSYNIASDRLFFALSLKNGAKFKYIDEPLVYMRRGGMSSGMPTTELLDISKRILGRYSIGKYLKKVIYEVSSQIIVEYYKLTRGKEWYEQHLRGDGWEPEGIHSRG